VLDVAGQNLEQAVRGVATWDGEEAITLLPDLEAGATGAMTGGAYPDGIRKIMDAWVSGDREKATLEYARWLPLINYENRQSGIIACEAPRHPFPAMHPEVRKGLIETARRLDPPVLRWTK
jgi:2-keto-3-deoxy-L-arabinonate dehydratase